MKSTHQNPTFNRFIGVDVSKSSLAIHDRLNGSDHVIDNTAKAIKAFFTKLRPTPATLVLCEATGGYEAALLSALGELGIAAHRASANRIKSFIASDGTLSKTDAGDARAIAQYGFERHHRLALWEAPDRECAQLQALVLRRDDLVAMRTAETNRRKAPGTDPGVVRSCKAHIAFLNRQIMAIEKAIRALINSDEPLRQKFDILVAIAGIGTITAAAILAHLPEIGTLTRRQAASIAGLAPHPNDSGKYSGYRAIRGGRRPLRRALYMPAMQATQNRSPFSPFYNKLKQNGKKSLVAITAIMRKILAIANAKIRDYMIMQRQS